MATELIRGYCALCISRCGCIGTVEDGVLTRVDPDPEHPTGQALCVKARAAPEAVYNQQRILQPLRRTHPKGDANPGWEPISWDDALDLVAERMRAALIDHGPTGLAFGVATPSGTAMSDSFGWVHRLAHACGSPNMVFATENCNWHKDFSPAYTFGTGIGMPDYANTGCIVLWGFNPATSWLSQATQVKLAQKRGAKLIVIDPRRAGLANSADLWLRPRPGSDGALAMGLINLMLQGGNYDRDFIARWSDAPFLRREDTGQLLIESDITGEPGPNRYVYWDTAVNRPIVCPDRPPNFSADVTPALSGHYKIQTVEGAVDCRPVLDILAKRGLAWPVKRVAEVTGIPTVQIEEAARTIVENSPISFFTWTGTCQQSNATTTTQAITSLYTLTGSLDAPGGNVWFAKPPIADISGFEWRSEVEPTLGLAERPLGPPSRGWCTTRDLFRAITQETPYPVSCLVSFGSNFLLSKPRTALTEEALANLDFFVLSELYETPTARYADLLLPVCTCWEREGLQPGFQVSAEAEAHIQLRPAFVPPQGESRSDTWIVFELAKRLGLEKQFFEGDLKIGLEFVLDGTGLTTEQLRAEPRGITLPLVTKYRKYCEEGFKTPSGRVEFFSQRLWVSGADPLPDYVKPTETCQSTLPLILTTAKWPQYCHSQHRNLPSLRRRMPYPIVEINPDAAAARSIAEGDWVMVKTRLGQMRARAHLDRYLAKETVCSQYGWWQFADGAGHANRLIDGEVYDPLSGSNSLRHCPCEVSLWVEHNTLETIFQDTV